MKSAQWDEEDRDLRSVEVGRRTLVGWLMTVVFRWMRLADRRAGWRGHVQSAGRDVEGRKSWNLMLPARSKNPGVAKSTAQTPQRQAASRMAWARRRRGVSHFALGRATRARRAKIVSLVGSRFECVVERLLRVRCVLFYAPSVVVGAKGHCGFVVQFAGVECGAISLSGTIAR